jgi:hypothetical protein
MLDQFKQTLTKLFALGNERANVARTRGMLERLEDRMMLSATYGDFGYNPPAATSRSYADFGGPPAISSAAYSSPPVSEQMVAYGSYSVSSVREASRASYEYQSYAGMQSAFALPQRVSAIERPWQPQAAWNQSLGTLPPRSESRAHSVAETTNMSRLLMTPTYAVSIYYVEVVWAGPPGAQLPSTPDWDEYSPPRLGLAQPGGSNNPTSPTYLNDTRGAGTAGGQGNGGSNPGPLWGAGDQRYWINPSGPGLVFDYIDNGGIYIRPSLPIDRVLANAAFASDSTFASQMLAHETTTAGVLNAIARDLAFQEFSPNLFQFNATISLDRTSLEAVGRQTTQSDLNDGLAVPTDEAPNNVVMNPSDAVAREREAVDAVLDDLEDVDSIVPAPDSQVQGAKSKLPSDSAFDVVGADQAEDGMVLLQSTGDANGNVLDLTPVYAEHVERLTAPAKMEASIGIFYQAMDVAADDAPLMEVASQTSPTSQATREIKPSGQLPATREQPSAGKAAALVGATTLTGALVWMNRGGRVARQNPTAQKRRVIRR